MCPSIWVKLTLPLWTKQRTENVVCDGSSGLAAHRGFSPSSLYTGGIGVNLSGAMLDVKPLDIPGGVKSVYEYGPSVLNLWRSW